MFDIGGPELIMILVGVLILFGAKNLPELAQGLGKGLRQFRRAQQEFNDQITSAMREEERKKNDEWKRPIDPMTVARGGESRETPGVALPNGSSGETGESPGLLLHRRRRRMFGWETGTGGRTISQRRSKGYGIVSRVSRQAPGRRNHMRLGSCRGA